VGVVHSILAVLGVGVINGGNRVTLSPTSTTRFFRLSQSQ
jgi:hypothetical protein